MIKIDFPFHQVRMLGDVVVSGKNDLIYVGNGKYIMAAKDKSTKLDQGEAIKLYLSQGNLNQYVVRKGKVIAARKNKNILKSNKHKNGISQK